MHEITLCGSDLISSEQLKWGERCVISVFFTKRVKSLPERVQIYIFKFF